MRRARSALGDRGITLTASGVCSPRAMQATGTRIAVVVIALTMLVALVAVSGRETIRGVSEKPAPARPAPARPAPLVTPEFPPPGSLPPDVFVIGEEPGPPAW